MELLAAVAPAIYLLVVGDHWIGLALERDGAHRARSILPLALLPFAAAISAWVALQVSSARMIAPDYTPLLAGWFGCVGSLFVGAFVAVGLAAVNAKRVDTSDGEMSPPSDWSNVTWLAATLVGFLLVAGIVNVGG